MKVIQIAVIPETESRYTEVLALRDDGEIFSIQWVWKAGDERPTWQRINPVPGTEAHAQALEVNRK